MRSIAARVATREASGLSLTTSLGSLTTRAVARAESRASALETRCLEAERQLALATTEKSASAGEASIRADKAVDQLAETRRTLLEVQS